MRNKGEIEKSWWKNKKLTAEEKNDMLVETCRKVFSTDDGKIVLNMLLHDLRVFAAAKDGNEQALNEYGKFFIRERLGVRDIKSITDYIAETAFAGRG